MTYDAPQASVRLRPLTLDDCTVAEAVTETAEDQPYSFYGFTNPTRLRKSVESGDAYQSWGDQKGRLAIEAGGEYVGDVSWHQVHYGPIPAPAINFGISVIPSARGKGHGSEAQRLLVAYLFQNTTVNRVEASTDVENLAEQRALEKAGLQREGITRGCHFRNGEYRDMVVYALLRKEHEEATAKTTSKIRTGFTA